MRVITDYLKKAGLPNKVFDEPIKDRDILELKSIPVPPWNKKILAPLIRHMNNVMLKENGVGLAAIQVGIPLRIFVIRNLGEFINPQVLSQKGLFLSSEGCLSLDGNYTIKRYAEVKAKWRDMSFGIHTVRLLPPASIIFQHEFDHLEGVTIDKK